ncbi:MAG: FtsH protease activity modulator HflK [Oceanospirillaceae bacterium]|nr:FtsH protease activity modulator HflK [Oceanospirillaceae bacterium]
MAWNEPGGNGKNQDPWGNGDDKNRKDRGKGGNEQGPPDLDEALGQLQDKLSEIFGGKKKGSGSGNKMTGPTNSPMMFGVLFVIAALVWGGLGFYTVDQQERGVVLRLGKFSEVVGPGLQWNPPLVDKVTVVNTTRVRSSDHNAQMLTGDENIVDVGMTVQYVVSDASAFVLQVRSPDQSLGLAAESALRHVVGGSDMDSILTQGRNALAVEVQSQLQSNMQIYGTGIQVTQVNIKNAQAPDQVQHAFDDVIKAREDEQRSKNEAETYAKGILPEARGAAKRMLAEADAYKQQVVANAEGEAARFSAVLAEYKKAPNVTRERLYLDTMQKVLSNNSKVLVDVEGGNNVMFLPLDKLMQNRSAANTGGSARLDAQAIREVSDQVYDQLRRNQTTRRESR